MGKKPKRKKRLDGFIRKPIGRANKFMTTKKGKKGYNRRRDKEEEWEEYSKE